MFFKKYLLILTFSFSSFSFTACAAEDEKKYISLGTTPRLINDYMKEIGCSPIRNFYSSNIVTEPPFVWLDSDEFAFVCERTTFDSEVKYELSVKKSNKKLFDSCPFTISLFAKPGGLTLENRMIEKNSFVSIDLNSPLKSSPQKVLPILVLSTGTGGYIEYICVDGSWYFNTYS